MRTTLTLDDDAFQAVKAKAAHENISFGKAASQLISQALKTRAPEGGGKAVFRSNGGIYTSSDVEEALADE